MRYLQWWNCFDSRNFRRKSFKPCESSGGVTPVGAVGEEAISIVCIDGRQVLCNISSYEFEDLPRLLHQKGRMSVWAIEVYQYLLQTIGQTCLYNNERRLRYHLLLQPVLNDQLRKATVFPPQYTMSWCLRALSVQQHIQNEGHSHHGPMKSGESLEVWPSRVASISILWISKTIVLWKM